MMQQDEALHVVFGATGESGGAVVRELVRQGRRVRAVNRSGRTSLPTGVELVRADAADPVSVREASANADVIYDCVGVPLAQWKTALLPTLKGIIAGASAAGAKLVMVDNVYMYGKVGGPFTEDLPIRPVGHLGELRAEMTAMLLQAHHKGDIRATIGRAADFYGPGVKAAIANETLFRQAMAGRRVTWPGKLDVPHSLMFVDDLARGLITLGEREEALGKVWHLPHAPALTPRQFFQMVFEEAGRTLRIGSLPGGLIRAAGLFDPTAREFAGLQYLFEAPFVVDSHSYEQAFGGEATPYVEGIRQTLTALGFG